MLKPFCLLFLLVVLNAQQVVAQKVDSVKMILDFWQHDEEWFKAPYDSLAKEMQNGIVISKYKYYEKLAPLVKKGDSKLMLYYEMSKNLTFEQLPAAVALLLEKIERIEKLLSGMEDKKPSEYLDISKAAAYLNLARATVYSKVCRREIPAYKNGSRLF